jgi:hypothetical protein
MILMRCITYGIRLVFTAESRVLWRLVFTPINGAFGSG